MADTTQKTINRLSTELATGKQSTVVARERIDQWRVQESSRVQEYTHTHTNTHTHTHIYIYIYTHTYIYPHTHTHTHIYIYIYIHTHKHIYVPFASVGDDTIEALTDLAAIFKLKLQQVPSPTTQASPAKVVPRSILAPSSTQILNSPMPNRRQTRSQTTIHTQDIPDVSLPPRVVTPRTLRQSPPRVPTGSQRLSPQNLSQDYFCGMESAHMAIALGNNHWSKRHHANAVIHPITRKEMEYLALMKDPSLQPLWTRGFGKECGRLFQGIRDIPGTDTCFFIELTNIRKIKSSLTAK
jgi:hypothetical protein